MKRLIGCLAALALLLTAAQPTSAHPTDEPDCAGETYAMVAAEGDRATAVLIASWQVLDTDCIVTPDQVSLIDGQEVTVLGGTKAVTESAVAGLNVDRRIAGADRVATARAVLDWIDGRNDEPASQAEPEEPDAEPTLRNVHHSHCRRYNTTTVHLCDRRFRPTTYSHSHDMSPDCIDYRSRAAGVARHWHNEDGAC